MALSWSQKRQLTYALVIIVVVVLPIALWLGVTLYEAPTCSDDEQNQGEQGIDCGGPCSEVCARGSEDLAVVWDRALKVREGSYNLVARINNERQTAGIKQVQYRFLVYDKNNNQLAQKFGTTYVNPGEQFVIFEPTVDVGTGTPARTSMVFEESPTWTETAAKPPEIEVVSRSSSVGSSEPRLTATLENPSLRPVKDIQVLVVLKGVDGNAIGASATYIDNFPRTSQQEVFFTWPEPFHRAVSEIEIIPRINVIRGQ